VLKAFLFFEARAINNELKIIVEKEISEDMLLLEEREELVKYGKMIIQAGLTKGTGGNFSIYNREKNLMAITPSGIPYMIMKPEDIVIMDLDGVVVEGNLIPSSEHAMHAMTYKNRSDVNAMVHIHSVFCTTLSALNEPLPAVDYLVAFSGGKEVKCAKYATYGTVELAENALEALGNQNAVLLANHGLNAVAGNMMMAFAIAEQIEFCAEIYIRGRSAGTPVILSEEEMTMMVKRFANYGQKVEA
jgi:L-fuculose-phosphate aldolase